MRGIIACVKKAILFDLDGTLLDTEESILSAFIHAFTTHKATHPARDNILRLMGRPIRDMYKMLAPEYDTERMLDAHREFQGQNLDLVKSFSGVPETLAKLRSAGLKLAIVTSRLRPSCIAYLEATNLRNVFATIVTGDDVKNQKPDPESVFRALTALDVLPPDAFMVGDTFADIGAGKNAGVATIGALYGHQGEGIRDLKPDYLIGSFEEILSIVSSTTPPP